MNIHATSYTLEFVYVRAKLILCYTQNTLHHWCCWLLADDAAGDARLEVNNPYHLCVSATHSTWVCVCATFCANLPLRRTSSRITSKCVCVFVWLDKLLLPTAVGVCVLMWMLMCGCGGGRVRPRRCNYGIGTDRLRHQQPTVSYMW